MFQSRLQAALIDEATCGEAGWKDMYSPRRDIFAHPLRERMSVIKITLVSEVRGYISSTFEVRFGGPPGVYPRTLLLISLKVIGVNY